VVTTTNIMAASPSTWIPSSTWNDPNRNHVTERSTVSAPPIICTNTIRDITNERPTARIPIEAPRNRVRLPRKMMRKNETSGITGISHACSITMTAPSHGAPKPLRGAA
jgi:hypothetical protein